MADEIPQALRQADVNIYKCATKAVQLQAVKPIVAYWCEYWVVNQVLARQLHSTSEEVLTYTTQLMDKLEQTKADYAYEDAIIDDTAGQAYVEQFAQETLDRAERVVKANKVTQQTATTFDAAATFFHLINIWGVPDAETQQKIKYAKWNAARIARAIKEGNDPNESNPKREDPPPEPTMSPQEAEFGAAFGTSPTGVGPRPATVEDAPDGDSARGLAGSPLPQGSDVSPVRPGSAGGVSLPGVPSHIGQPPQPPQQPQQPTYFDSGSLPSPASPPQHGFAGVAQPPPNWTPTPSPQHSHSAFSPPSQHPSAPPSAQQPTFAPDAWSTPAVAPPPPPPANPAMNAGYMNVAPTANTVHHSAPPPAGVASSAPDEAAMGLAQKHAKWAISALNFEDVPTAVNELRRALDVLGAR